MHTFNEEVIADAINFEMSRNGQVFLVNNRMSNLPELKAMIERHIPKSQEPSQPRLAEKAKETRDGSDKLEQDSHDGQTPEREVERADGDAEH